MRVNLNLHKEIKDEILRKDLESIANSNIPLAELDNNTVCITGATGLIGSQLVMAILFYNKLHKTNIKIIAFARDPKKAKEIFGRLLSDSHITMIYQDITQPINLATPIDYIVHTASVTSSRLFISKPVETILTALKGMENVLDFARENKVKSLVYTSSIEVYGQFDSDIAYVTEEDYGVIDTMNVRSSYSESKRMAESLCKAYFHEFGTPVKIARLTQTFGAGVDLLDERVFAQFARSVLEKKNIVLHTPGKTVRSYCYTSDAISALIYILVKGESGQAYNVANMESRISIIETAELLTEVYSDTGIKVVYDFDKDTAELGYNPVVKINLDTTKLESLGWSAKIGLVEMYERMIGSMRYRNEIGGTE